MRRFVLLDRPVTASAVAAKRQPRLPATRVEGKSTRITEGSLRNSSAEKSLRRPSKQVDKTKQNKLKPSKRIRTHPSKEREKARQLEHDRRARRWESSQATTTSSAEWADQYFDEKWVHTQGRLSDWNPPTEDQPSRAAHERASHKDSLREAVQEGDADQQSEASPLHRTDATMNANSHSLGASGERESPEAASSISHSTEVRPRFRFFATCHPGLEPAVAAELGNPTIDANSIRAGQTGVEFWGSSLETGYRACLWLRCAIRVLVLLAEGPIDATTRGGDVLYAWIREAADWPEIISKGQRFSVEARVRDCPGLWSTELVMTRVRDAICDAIKDTRGEKLWPPNPEAPPNVPLFVALYRNTCSLYRDMAGTSLHRRGYRSAMAKAPLNEAAAAGILTLAGWPRPDTVLADPMCGSGTFLIEAALIAMGVASGLGRSRWPFQSWPDFGPQAWAECVANAQQLGQSGQKKPVRLVGNDVHGKVLRLAKRDAQKAGVAEMIGFTEGHCRTWRPALPPDLVITNPPWGLRLQSSRNIMPQQSGPLSGSEGDDVLSSWQELRAFLQAECSDADAYILTGNTQLASELHMKTSQRTKMSIGGKDCRLLKYQIYPKKYWAN